MSVFRYHVIVHFDTRKEHTLHIGSACTSMVMQSSINSLLSVSIKYTRNSTAAVLCARAILVRTLQQSVRPIVVISVHLNKQKSSRVKKNLRFSATRAQSDGRPWHDNQRGSRTKAALHSPGTRIRDIFNYSSWYCFRCSCCSCLRLYKATKKKYVASRSILLSRIIKI